VLQDRAFLRGRNWGVLQSDVRSGHAGSVWLERLSGLMDTCRDRVLGSSLTVLGLEADERAADRYTRVSSLDQNADRQLDGVALDRVFTDSASGRSTARPQLEALLAFVRDGDTVLVHSMDRLARNLDDLRALVRTLTAGGCGCSSPRSS